MRLWHKDLIDVLPDKQLNGQWKEIFMVIGSIEKHGYPRHGLVNILMDYSPNHLVSYAYLVFEERTARGFKTTKNTLDKLIDLSNKYEATESIDQNHIFFFWHNHRYLRQCLYNLQEKYDRGLITTSEWLKISEKHSSFYN